MGYSSWGRKEPETIEQLPCGSAVKNLPANAEDAMWIQSLNQEDPLEEEMASYSSILAWKILGTEDSGGLQSMESQSQTRLSMHTDTYIHTKLYYEIIIVSFSWMSKLWQ